MFLENNNKLGCTDGPENAQVHPDPLCASTREPGTPANNGYQFFVY